MVKTKAVDIELLLLIITITLNIPLCSASAASANNPEDKIAILVDIADERLFLINCTKNLIIKSYPVASGRPDTPSPVGSWKVVSLGKWSGGFGTRWIGLNVPWGRYGIHGTNSPHTIGSEASHGCIRMFNSDIEELYEYVKVGMIITVYAGPYGPFEKGLVNLVPGDRGSAICEIQRKMKAKGYYPGYIDGIYGEGMKKYVIKFRNDNKLSNSHVIDKSFYNKLGISLID